MLNVKGILNKEKTDFIKNCKIFYFKKQITWQINDNLLLKCFCDKNFVF